MSQIFGPSGKPLVAVGGEHSWKQFRRGDVVCSLQWAGKPGEIEPAMCLFPNVGNTRAGVFVLCLSSLHKYVKTDGYASDNLKNHGWQAIAKQLGLDENSREIRAAVCSLIEEVAPELVWMPPAPTAVRTRAEPEKVGVMTLRQGHREGRIVHEAEI